MICQLILGAIEERHPKRHVLSVDEKTGIQALERLEGKAPESKGGHRRKEFEYTRHGTTCLIAAFDVAKGNIASQRIHPTRTEADFTEFIENTVPIFPDEDEIVFLADQLNTHMSESLVKYIAEIENFEGGKFSAYGGGVHGETILLRPHQKIVQKWRSMNWTEGLYSELTYDLKKDGEETVVNLTQTGVPDDDFDKINEGWEMMYWGPMRKYFEK